MTRVPRRVPARRPLARAALVALALAPAPALGQPGGRPARPGPDRAAQERAVQERTAQERGGPPVIACPSLANYRLLMRAGAPAAAAVLADPKADHLGCAALARGRITGVADRVSLGGRDYDCAGVQGTTACHWTEAGALPEAPVPAPAATSTPAPSAPSAPAPRSAGGR